MDKQIIKPTVGRVVWYWPSPDEIRGHYGFRYYSDLQRPPQPCDAHVLYVHDDRLVNLLVMDHYGNPHVRTSTILVQEDDPKPDDRGFCQWMPYQVGQAKKHADEAQRTSDGT